MNKKLIILLALPVLILFVAFLALPAFVDKNAIKSEVTESFKALTGMALEIQGDATVEVLPSPHILINSLYVRNLQDATSPFLLSVKQLDVHPAFMTLFKGKPVIESLNISGVDVELERLKGDRNNWSDKSLRAPVAAVASTAFNNVSVTIDNALVRYTDSVAGGVSEYKDIALSLAAGTESSISGHLHYKDRPFVINGHIGKPVNKTAFASLTLSSGSTSVKYEGDAGFENNNYILKGKTSFKTDDLAPWIALLLNTTARKDIPHTPLPLEAQSDVSTDAGKIQLPQLLLNSPIIKGAMQVTISQPLNLQVKGKIDTLDLETLFATGILDLSQTANAPASDEFAPILAPKPIINSLALNANIGIADISYNQQHIKDTQLGFDMAGGEMTISQASAVLPGEARVVFTGIGKDGYQGFTFEGQIDAVGNSFSEMLKVIRPQGLALPAEDFKRFRIKTVAVISPKELRFSEIAARVENIALVGGAVTTLGARPKIEAALRISGLNLDHFTTLWGLKEWQTSFLENTPGPKNEGHLAQCLKKLGYDLRINTSLEQYILNGLLRARTDLKLEATQGKINFSDIKTNYNGTNLSGALGVDVTGTLPFLNIDITADTLDTATFFTADGKALPQPISADRWSHNEVDMHWLELFNANYHFKAGHFKKDALAADTLEIKGGLNDRTLTIDSVSALVLGGQAVAKATVKGSKSPIITLASNMVGVDAKSLVPFLPAFEGLVGKYNMTLQLDTTGIDAYSWISNLQGTVHLGGRNVVVHGFDMAGIIRSVSYVRTVADILNVVKKAFPGGDTEFSNIEGEWLVTGGVLRAANVKMVNPEFTGTLAGDADLVNWKIGTRITFALTSLDRNNPPSMTVGFSGSLDAPEKLLDTRSLEQYVTNRTSEKMLNQYGTH